MADVPRDPRQLARDILAGKVRIEDLARERQIRGGGAPAPRLQAKIPVPRQAPLPPPVQRTPVRPMQRPMPPRPVMPQTPRPVQRPPMMPAARPPQRSPLQVTIAPPEPVRATIMPAPEPVAATKVARRAARINELVRSKHALRQGIVLAEVLGKPLALRDET